ncbi:hypothetical protein [Vibrio sp. TRT 17S01]|uniref:hypothetical protein n=1 Tax=Vibrio sp. TRT 17S01 TaxID=3418505 RepID=UPI003CEA9A33
MSSLFDSARSLLRASIADCFGSTHIVTTPEGDRREIIGYIRTSAQGNHIVHRLISSDVLPESCLLDYQGKRYLLVYEEPLRDAGSDSQIALEYTMAQQTSGGNDGWSEYPK